MEGGVAIFLLLVLAVVVVGLGIALYVTGGAIFLKKDEGEAPPRGKIDPVDENTTAMRTSSEREDEREHEPSGQSRR